MNLCAIWCFAHNAQKLTNDYMCMQQASASMRVSCFCRINYSNYNCIFEYMKTIFRW